LYVCRDRWHMLASVLRPHSLVVIGVPRRWWPTREERVARKLRRSDPCRCQVIVNELSLSVRNPPASGLAKFTTRFCPVLLALQSVQYNLDKPAAKS
jgi:hypothetical protein